MATGRPPGVTDLAEEGELGGSLDLAQPRDFGGLDLGGLDLGGLGDMGMIGGPAGALCDPAGWCWENPLPHGSPIQSVWGPSSTDIWAVGGAGVVEHWNGTAWSLSQTPTHAMLRDVWGTASNDAWAVGQAGTIVHWNGAAWSAFPSSTTQDLSAIWGSSATDIWAVARVSESLVPGYYHHTFVHWNGSTWTSMLAAPVDFLPSTITDMWGCSATEIYAVGTTGKGTVFKWNGTAWIVIMVGSSSSTYTGVWCSGPGQKPWFAYKGCPMGMCTGTIYGSTAWGRPDYDVATLAASGPSDIWTYARTLNLALHPSLTLHWNGTIWEELSGTLLAPGFTDKPGSHFLWQGADIRHRASITDPWVSSKKGTFADLHGVWGTAADKMWAVGANGTIVARSAAGDWQPMTSPTTKTLNAVWGASPTQMWAAGDGGTLLAGNGVRWVALSVGVTDDLTAISGTGPNDVWVAGWNEVLHFDGLGWSKFSSTVGGLALSALSPSEVWLASDTAVWRFDGTSWNQQTIKTVAGEGSFGGVWAISSSDVWIVGSIAFYHFDGTSFSTINPGVDRLGGAIWGSGPGDLWARASLHEQPINLRWDGTAWKPQPSDTGNPLFAYSLFGLKGVGVWGAGPFGSIIRYSP